ncbi:MAG: CBS domain-containing protein [Planctomycetales bacterium]|nr:CBS domain-containing protein [Planctomycetales bacterium]NIM10208.1 CBS domain-containing protein [Planctomycetales bacterium]NIN09625.1 CBS domain-containing protein [Planctomycetales bacterium]NIN78751.1 CBS domain-containing protein [Planctomycetales bacterium]NIO35925.1 CBS domain-containing protein [Planctomycetales bacterium]
MSDSQFPSPEDFQDPLENYEPKTYEDPLEQALAEETVSAIRHEPYVRIPPDTPVQAAVEKLAGLHVACLLVEQEGKLVGVFSDRDVLSRVAEEYDQLKDQPVSEVMTNNPIYVYETDSPAAALAVMAVAGYRHVPVLNLDDQLVGIVSPQRVTAFLHRYFA